MAVDDPYTKSQLHLNADFYDESGKNWSAFVGTPSINTNTKKFGAGSLWLDSASGLSTPHHEDFVFGDGDFSVDFWAYPVTQGQANNSVLVYKSTNATLPSGYLLAQKAGTYDVGLWLSTNGSTYNLLSAQTIGTMAANAWNHLFFGRVGSNSFFGVGGTVGSVGIGTASLYDNAAYPLALGYGTYSNTAYAGYIDEFRVSKGICRWSSSFTPPTKEYAPSLANIGVTFISDFGIVG